MNATHRWAVVALLVALAASVFSWWLSLPPTALPASAPAAEFSAERAIEHIKVMAKETHPTGSAANDEVARYIEAQLKEMGVEYVIFDGPMQGGSDVNMNRCILARLRGAAPTRAFAMDAHFDSVPYGPGGTDDLSGIAAMLETLRALKAGPALKNDVIFSFADQEESGGGGAKAFVAHPWFKDVGVMLGLETRGVSGAGLMFETNKGNGWVIEQLAKAGCNPRATSIMFDFYDRLPFGSDFGKYKQLVPGYNVAYVDTFSYYHISLDNAENANPASVQHHGAYCLGLARHLGNLDLSGDLYAPNATYFNTLGGHMIVYSQRWNWPLGAWIAAAFLAVLTWGLISKRLSLLGVLAGFFGALGVAVLVAAPTAGASYLLFLRFKEMMWYSNYWYCGSYALLTLAFLFAFLALCKGRIEGRNLLAGVLIWWMLGLFFLLFKVPGGAYAATWPLAFGTLCLGLLCWLARKPEHQQAKGAALGVLLVLPPLMMICPTLVMLAYTLTAIAGFALCILLVLLLALLFPQASLLPKQALKGCALVALSASLVLLLAGYIANRPSPTTPYLNCLAYGVDYDAGKAYWMSSDKSVDEWTGLYIPEDSPKASVEEFYEGHKGKYLKAEAPMPTFRKPRIDVRSDTTQFGRRTLDLLIHGSETNFRYYLSVVSPVQVFEAEFLGLPLKGRREGWKTKCERLPRQGASLKLVVEADKPLKLHVREIVYGLPQFPGMKPRLDWMAAEPNRTLDHSSRPMRSEHTYAVCTVDLGEGKETP